jgi:hypothetical protein
MIATIKKLTSGLIMVLFTAFAFILLAISVVVVKLESLISGAFKVLADSKKVPPASLPKNQGKVV